MYTNSQTATLSAAGEYYLQGVMETASGFKLNEDSSFQFFFSYGALDRYGSGTWSSSGNKIIFNSTKKHDADFALVQSQKHEGKRVTVKITDANKMLLRHVYCVIRSGDKEQKGFSDANGTISFEPQQVDSVTLLFEFCPERETKITLPVKDHNYFEFRFEPWIMEVFFKNFSLQSDETGLNGPHPLLDGNDHHYSKAGNH